MRLLLPIRFQYHENTAMTRESILTEYSQVRILRDMSSHSREMSESAWTQIGHWERHASWDIITTQQRIGLNNEWSHVMRQYSQRHHVWVTYFISCIEMPQYNTEPEASHISFSHTYRASHRELTLHERDTERHKPASCAIFLSHYWYARCSQLARCHCEMRYSCSRRCFHWGWSRHIAGCGFWDTASRQPAAPRPRQQLRH